MPSRARAVVIACTTAFAAVETLTDAELIERASELIAGGQSARDVATELAAATGRPRRDVYRIIVREHG